MIEAARKRGRPQRSVLNRIRSSVEGIEPSDTILAPTIGPQVGVVGRRPDVYELSNGTGLSDVLELAGGY
jgi:hypothetical protein